MLISVDTPTRDGVEFIADNMRPEDLYECAAHGFAPAQLPDAVSMLLHRGVGHMFIDAQTRDPVFVWGVSEAAVRGVYQLWGFGTDKTRRAMPKITKWGLRVWLPAFPFLHPDARRIEVRVPVSSAHSIGWLRKLGMEIEARLPRYSVHGEDFFQLAMTFPANAANPKATEYVSSPMDGRVVGPASDSSSAEQVQCGRPS